MLNSICFLASRKQCHKYDNSFWLGPKPIAHHLVSMGNAFPYLVRRSSLGGNTSSLRSSPWLRQVSTRNVDQYRLHQSCTCPLYLGPNFPRNRRHHRG